MKTILTLLLILLVCKFSSAQTFGLGIDGPVETATISTADTFGLASPPALNVPRAANFRDFVPAPVYETVNVTTGFKTVCFGDHCEQVPIVTSVRRLVTATPRVSVAVAKAVATTGEACPCGMVNTAANVSVSGSPPSGFHDHTDSAGNTWRHEHWNNGNTAAHVSPYTGELVLNRSADGGGDFVTRSRFAPVRSFRSRFGFRR